MRNLNAKVSDPNKFVCDPGSDVHILYNSKLLPNGEIVLYECGKESISEKINAQAMYTDINFLTTRLLAGDTSVIREGAIYDDFTKAPKTLAEALQIVIDGQKKFDELSLDTKSKFNNNYYQWVMEAGSVEWMEKMNIPINEIVEDVKESDQVNES